MKFEIIQNPSYSNLSKIGISLIPDVITLRFFFSSMRIAKFPELLKNVSSDLGYIGDPQGVIFYKDLDGEDFLEGDIFENEEVKVYHHNFGEEIINKHFFKSILLSYSDNLLKVYKNSDELSISWSKEMEHYINVLEKNINSD